MIPPQRRARAHRLPPLLLASLLLCPAAFAAGQASQESGKNKPEVAPYEGVDPGGTYKIDIRGGRILEVLPFDVQFFFEATVSSDLARATGRYRGSKKFETCEGLFGRVEEVPPPTKYLCSTQAECAKLPPAPAEDRPGTGGVQGRRAKRGLAGDIAFVRVFDDATTKDDGTQQKIELSVPEILPNRHYCFEFTLEDRVSDLEAFHEQVETAIKDEFEARIVGATTEEYNALRQRLIGTIMSQLKAKTTDKPAETLRAPPRSFFDPRSSLWEVEQSFLAELNAIVETQKQRRAVLDNLGNSKLDAADSLTELIQNPAFMALREGKSFLPAMPMLDLTEDRIPALAQGLGPNQTEPDLAKTKSVGGQLDRLAATSSQLEDLKRRVQDLAMSPRRLEFFKQDRDSMRLLITLVDRAVFALGSVAGDLRELASKLTERDLEIDRIVGQLDKQLLEVVRIQGTSFAKYETRAGFYLSADVGLGYAPDLDDVFTYVGTNIYFRPVNKKAPLRGSFRKRFSIMLGFTVDEPTKENAQVKGVLMNRSLLLAGGIRISDHFRISIGTVVFEEAKPDPLISDEELVWSPFISASVDWNLRSLFGRIGGAFAEK